MFYFVFGEILTPEAHVPILLMTLTTTLLLVQSPIPLQGVFNAFIFKGKSVRFQQRMKGLFAKFVFFKVLLRVQYSKLFIWVILSCYAYANLVARPLSWGGLGGGGGEGGWGGEIVRVSDKN